MKFNFLILCLILDIAIGAVTDGSKRIIFVRHGESTWNVAKRSFFSKIGHLFTRDVHLSKEGVTQCSRLKDWVSGTGVCSKDPNLIAEFVQKAKLGDVEISSDRYLSAFADCDEAIRGALKDRKIQWATSNLRRALETAVIVRDAQRSSVSPMAVMSALQETESGRDARSLTEKGKKPVIDWGEVSKPVGFQTPNMDNIEATRNNGDYNAENVKAQERFVKFCDFARTVEGDSIVVAGHSSWLLQFFRTRHSVDTQEVRHNLVEELLAYHHKISVKLGNASVIAFDYDLSKCTYLTGSTHLVYGTLEVKKKNGGGLRTDQVEHIKQFLAGEVEDSVTKIPREEDKAKPETRVRSNTGSTQASVSTDSEE